MQGPRSYLSRRTHAKIYDAYAVMFSPKGKWESGTCRSPVRDAIDSPRESAFLQLKLPRVHGWQVFGLSPRSLLRLRGLGRTLSLAMRKLLGQPKLRPQLKL